MEFVWNCSYGIHFWNVRCRQIVSLLNKITTLVKSRLFSRFFFAYLELVWIEKHEAKRDNINIIIISQSVFYSQITFNWRALISLTCRINWYSFRANLYLSIPLSLHLCLYFLLSLSLSLYCSATVLSPIELNLFCIEFESVTIHLRSNNCTISSKSLAQTLD